MIYIFFVTYKFEHQGYVQCIYITTFDGVWMLATVLNQSKDVDHFTVTENRVYVSPIKFDAENLEKWK